MSRTVAPRVLSATAVAVLVSIALLPVASAGVPQAPDTEQVNSRIREEGWERSQVMRTLHFLTDRYGPRLTGSPNLEAAGEWAIDQMTDWGFANGHLEGFDWGHPGWLNESFSVDMIAPVKDTLVGEVLAWTPSTDGVVTAAVFHLVAPGAPTEAELQEFFVRTRADVAGKIVLVGEAAEPGVNFNEPAKRRDDEQLQQQYDPNYEPPARGGRGGRRGPERDPDVLAPNEVAARVDQFLIDNGAAVRINDGGRAHGQIRAFANRAYDPAQALPTVILRNEDFGRIARLLEYGDPVVLSVDIVNRDYPQGSTVYNAVAEIPGSDKADEVIMLGGHLDSWHAATGATDNATGVTVMMEAARILKAIGVQPRRTIRVALWAGEEQGLLGSQAYVAEHFGSFEDPKPDYYKFGGYFNVDSGTGRVRGASVFGPPEAAEPLREAFAPFSDLGIVGARSTESRRLGGTDSTSFNQAGLPGIGMQQDPIEYNSTTWHTNLDTYERAIEEDLKSSAIVIAAAVYQLAMADELLPRFPADQMPAPPGGQ
ncbi:MAG: M20/M25/M40 family metallo-hydrolase [Acidobacteriota bacterium]|jgi:hypothetical protein